MEFKHTNLNSMNNENDVLKILFPIYALGKSKMTFDRFHNTVAGGNYCLIIMRYVL